MPQQPPLQVEVAVAAAEVQAAQGDGDRAGDDQVDGGELVHLCQRQAAAEPLRLDEFGVAGPLLDMAKLDDVSGDFVATLSGEQILDRLLPHAGAGPDLD